MNEGLKGETLPSLALKFNVNIHNIKYLIRLLNKHGYSILRNDKNKYYSKEFKEIAINRVLIKKESLRFVAAKLGFFFFFFLLEFYIIGLKNTKKTAIMS